MQAAGKAIPAMVATQAETTGPILSTSSSPAGTSAETS